MPYVETTGFESEQIMMRLCAGDSLPAAVQRYRIFTDDVSVVCKVETNDDNDDGYPDGAWTYWTERFPTLDQALKACGKCRVGISGVIVTVTLDGKEIR